MSLHCFLFVTAGEFGSERLVQKVVDTILRTTAVKDRGADPGETSAGAMASGGPETSGAHAQREDAAWKDDTASKIILTGYKVRSLQNNQTFEGDSQ